MEHDLAVGQDCSPLIIHHHMFDRAKVLALADENATILLLSHQASPFVIPNLVVDSNGEMLRTHMEELWLNLQLNLCNYLIVLGAVSDRYLSKGRKKPGVDIKTLT